MRVCLRGEPRAGVSDRTTARPRPLLWLGPSWAPDRLAGTRGAGSLRSRGTESAAGGRGRSRHGKLAAAPCEPDPGSRADPEPGPGAACASESGASNGRAGAGATGRREGGATSQPETNRQLIPELSPICQAGDNRSRAHPPGPPRRRLRPPGRAARTPTFLHTRGCPVRVPRLGRRRCTFRGAPRGDEHLRAIVRPQGWPATSGARGICGKKRGGVGVGVQLLPRPP